MSSLSRILCVCALFCTQSLLACGGSTSDHESPTNGENAGSSSSDDAAGAGRHSAGAPASDGQPAAGTGGANGVAGSAGATPSPSPTPSGTKLSEVKTDAQALALCNQIKRSVSDADLKKMLRGSCAISAQTGAASELGSCEDLQADCAAHTPVPSTADGCTADDIPDCDNVTVEEYVACTGATIALGIEYLSKISCDTDLQSLEPMGTASVCAGPFARCPEYASAYQ